MRIHSKKIVFLIPYPLGEAPSQRFRFEQYLPLLHANQLKVTILPFFNQSSWKLLYSTKQVKKNLQILQCIIKRPIDLFRISTSDFVFIHREVMPIGPPILEWIIKFIFQKKIIYDFDDAIWLTDKASENSLQKIVRWRSKVSSICKWSYKVSCGNEYLAQYARQFNKQVVINPTTIDTTHVHNPSLFKKKTDEKIITIGWTGSHSTLKYLSEAEQALHQLEQEGTHIKFRVIADRKPELKLKSLEFIPWRKETEIQDLYSIDIGIMPLPDDDWSKGKCGFKALQYMALEIPTIASAVGVNTTIVDHGKNGFLCSNQEEWISSLTTLIRNGDLRQRFGKSGRQKIIDQFSVLSNKDRFLSLFQ